MHFEAPPSPGSCQCYFFNQQVLNQGKGYAPFDTESGQLLIDRAVHLDVLEYLLWINSWVALQGVGGLLYRSDLS